MRVGGIEEGSLLKIDEILLRDLDKEEKLRTVSACFSDRTGGSELGAPKPEGG